ncbi:hypothetical protein EV182_000140 [Spiromyces aspiralis]|uniref:Uncharacterized protein n=1 Tax=Spiromyces aspiralis TaxID=68401 RepID=A0ACC1HX49_9FUNG|nr:hypothetical protein EV182_000140 [Spiromyces aspiralis]
MVQGARFFDIDRVKDVTNPLPHMLPPADVFEEEMGKWLACSCKFGISNGDHVVIYDSAGFGPACRVGWTFHVGSLLQSELNMIDEGL